MLRDSCRTLLLLSVLFGVRNATQAQSNTAPGSQPPTGPQPTVIRLAIDPAPEPRPALKYSLLPRLNERKPGNAAPFYYRAILEFTRRRDVENARSKKSASGQLDEWRSAPIESFPVEEVKKVVQSQQFVYEQLKTAAYREHCEWEWREQDLEGTSVVEFRLDEIQESRDIARFLAAKARLEIAEHRYDDAIETLRIGFQFARDIGKSRFIISRLVGIAIVSILNDQVHTLEGTPSSPNLYWALTELPHPIIDLQPAIEFELTSPFRVFPWLNDPEATLHSPQQWAQIITEGFHTAFHLESNQQPGPMWQSRLAVTALALGGYTRAKRDLIAAGYDRSKLEQMPVGQVIATYEARLGRYIIDEMRKWTLFPYAEGHRRAEETQRRLARDHYLSPPISSREVVPIMSLLLPAASAAYDAESRRETSLAADRTIEAIRMHATTNGGKLPGALSEITIVPVPPSRRTGQPFPYRVEGSKAILEVRLRSEAPAPLEQSDEVFEITLVPNERKVKP